MLRCLFVAVLAACATAGAGRTMSSAELDAFMADWDDAFGRNDFQALMAVWSRAGLSASGPDPYGGTASLLAVDNPEVLERVLELYKAECQSVMRVDGPDYQFLSRQPGFKTYPWTNWKNVTPGSEEGMEFADELASVVEATLDPRIYWHVWFYSQRSAFRPQYLATLQPETSIDLLLRGAEAWRADSEPNATEFIRLGHGAIVGMPDLFTLLRAIVSENPGLIEPNRPALLAAIRKFGAYYRRGGPYRTYSGGYAEARDYTTRTRALRLIEQIGRAEDLPLIDELTVDAPETRVGLGGHSRNAPPKPTVRELAETVRAALAAKK